MLWNEEEGEGGEGEGRGGEVLSGSSSLISFVRWCVNKGVSQVFVQ